MVFREMRNARELLHDDRQLHMNKSEQRKNKEVRPFSERRDMTSEQIQDHIYAQNMRLKK